MSPRLPSPLRMLVCSCRWVFETSFWIGPMFSEDSRAGPLHIMWAPILDMEKFIITILDGCLAWALPAI
jgi:hypothetical protein